MNNVLQKTKSNTLNNIAAERHHNYTGNRPGIFARLELIIKESKISRSAGGNSNVEYTYGWYSGSAENNDMQGIISNVKL
jgi:hypothetical protein